VALFKLFAGTRNFNPMAIVFEPLTWPRRFPSTPPSKRSSHGRPQEVEEMRNQLFEILDRLAPPASTA
jgi:hypothetical protein